MDNMNNFKEYEEYMPDEPAGNLDQADKKQNKALWIIIAVIIALIVILGVLFGTGVINLQDNGSDQAAAIATLEVSGLGLSSANLGAGNENGVSADGYIYFTDIKFPVFSNPDLFDYEGGKNSCGDEIVWITAEVSATPAPLKATLNEMFNPTRDLGFSPGELGNIAAKQENLIFDGVLIADGVAIVSLSGEVSVDEDSEVEDCETSRLILQIQEAALQFDTVNSVQIFLNGDLL